MLTVYLHDATLLSVETRWSNHETSLTIKVRREEGIADLVFKKVTSIRIEANRPWGGSSSINSVVCSDERPGARCTIEMQTGDEIVVDYETLTCSHEGIAVESPDVVQNAESSD
jgi:hypothetical protein